MTNALALAMCPSRRGEVRHCISLGKGSVAPHLKGHLGQMPPPPTPALPLPTSNKETKLTDSSIQIVLGFSLSFFTMPWRIICPGGYIFVASQDILISSLCLSEYVEAPDP